MYGRIKFHTYLNRKTLPAEERVSKFHNHGKTPSYQNFADASMWKVVYTMSLKGKDEKAPLRYETGTECHDHPREIVGRSRQNCPDMEENLVYAEHLRHLHEF